jgi:hypothetical protein
MSGIRVWKMISNVPKRCRSQYCIRQRMQNDIGIAMTSKTYFMVDSHTTQYEITARNQPMSVVANTNSILISIGNHLIMHRISP